MRQVSDDFSKLFQKNAYIHWYTQSGMDQMEFTEAESNMNDIISEYEQGNGCFFDYGNEEYGEEEVMQEEG